MTRDTFKAKGTTIESSDSVALRAIAMQHADYSADTRGRESWEFDEHGLAQFAAALTLPASEAVESVRWHPKHGFNWKSVGDGPCGDTGTGWIDVPLFITPQPAPAAHAGGEAVAVDALREYVVGLKNVVDTADMMGGARTVLRWKIADELTALLSGGAAREGK